MASSYTLYSQYEVRPPLARADHNTHKLPVFEVTNISAADVKIKILSSIHKYKKEIEDKMGALHKIHLDNEHNEMYRLGYIVSYIDKEYAAILNMLRQLDKNNHVWPVTKVWKVYDQLRKGTKQVKDLLQKVCLKEPIQEHALLGPSNKFASQTHDIAWSYYDDDHF